MAVPINTTRIKPAALVFALLLTAFLACSCATRAPGSARLPADVRIDKDAGQGGELLVTVRLDNGEKLPLVLDTGAPLTFLEKSMEPKLGERLDSNSLWNFGVKQESYVYKAPRLFLGKSLLIRDDSEIATFDSQKLSFKGDMPFKGILGMDCLKHYCIQLDFKAGKIRFLDDERANKSVWGAPFPLVDVGDGCMAISNNLVGATKPGSLIDTGYDSDGWLIPDLYEQWTNTTKPLVNVKVRSPEGTFAGEKYQDLDITGIDTKLFQSGDPHVKYNGIGLRFLARHLVTFDFPHRTLYLKFATAEPLVDKHRVAIGKKMAKSVIKYLIALKKQGRLPGWSKDEHGSTQQARFRFDYPDKVLLEHIVKKGDTSNYHYECVRATENAPWVLKRAWRTDPDGKVIEEFLIKSKG